MTTFVGVHPNRPFENLTRFCVEVHVFSYISISLHNDNFCDANLCDWCLARIISMLLYSNAHC